MTTPNNQDWDVNEASDESFPASDPPAWGSRSIHAAPSESTVWPESVVMAMPSRRQKWLKRIAIAGGGIAAMFAVVLAVRYLHRR